MKPVLLQRREKIQKRKKNKGRKENDVPRKTMEIITDHDTEYYNKFNGVETSSKPMPVSRKTEHHKDAVSRNLFECFQNATAESQPMMVADFNKFHTYDPHQHEDRFSVSQNATPQQRNTNNYPVYFVSPTPEKTNSSREESSMKNDRLRLTQKSNDVENVLMMSGEKDSVYTLGQDSISSKSQRNLDKPNQTKSRRVKSGGRNIKKEIRKWMRKQNELNNFIMDSEEGAQAKSHQFFTKGDNDFIKTDLVQDEIDEEEKNQSEDEESDQEEPQEIETVIINDSKDLCYNHIGNDMRDELSQNSDEESKEYEITEDEDILRYTTKEKDLAEVSELQNILFTDGDNEQMKDSPTFRQQLRESELSNQQQKGDIKQNTYPLIPLDKIQNNSQTHSPAPNYHSYSPLNISEIDREIKNSPNNPASFPQSCSHRSRSFSPNTPKMNVPNTHHRSYTQLNQNNFEDLNLQNLDRSQQFVQQPMEDHSSKLKIYEEIIQKMSEEMKRLIISRCELQKYEKMEKNMHEMQLNMNQEKMVLNQKITKYMQRTQELESILEEKDQENAQLKLNIERVENQNIDLQLELKNINTTNARYSQSETELKNKIEQGKARICHQSESIRKLDEENYSLKSEIQNLQTDIVNMVNIEDSLRKELTLEAYRKKELEDSLSQMKSKICQDNITIRHLISQSEQDKRQIYHLNESIKYLKTENQDMKKEIELLKEKSFALEKQNLYLSNNVDSKDERIEELMKECQRTKSLFDTQREIVKKNETSLNRTPSLDTLEVFKANKDNTLRMLNENYNTEKIDNNQPQMNFTPTETEKKPALDLNDLNIKEAPLTSRNNQSNQESDTYPYSMRNQSSLGYLFNQDEPQNNNLNNQRSNWQSRSFIGGQDQKENLPSQNSKNEEGNFQMLRRQWQESVNNNGNGMRSLSRENYR
ncbi:unnamed protein product [Moneuplotes crassus]|uniref:Uncharacterized protein n=1 Tax=Euplotes crassus TaxID=5936 RepID=A0AAD2D757_EUPCR|nr:unnamed protein product [Moneuplotes crassus]